MSTVKELTLSPAGTVAAADEDDGADEDDPADVDDDEAAGDEDDVQPAAIRPATAATATQPNREMGLFLLPSSIQYTFRRNVCADTPTPGHRRNTSVLRDER
jgi:hypothetical protein